MPATMFVNFRSAVHKGSSGISIAFPDVCMTPCAPSPVPIPYPNIAQSSDAAKTATSVLNDGNEIMVKDSHFATSTGDEAGNAPGNVVTGVIKGKAYFIMYSFDVMAEGKNVCRFLDPMTHAHSSSPPPGSPPSPDTGGSVGAPTKVKVEKDRLSGEVMSVTLQSGIKLQNRGVKGRLLKNIFPAGELPPSGAPNWKREGDKPPPPEKSYPGVYTMKGPDASDKKMQVVVKITQAEGKFKGKEADLVGQYLNMEIKGKTKVTLDDGAETTVDCEFTELPGETCFDAGAGILWDLKVPGFTNPVCIGFTEIEIFFIAGKPKPPWGDSQPVYYDALKLAFERLMVGGFSAPLAIVDYLTRGLHRSGVRYDTKGGSARYNWWPFGGTLNLTVYLHDIANLPSATSNKVAPGPYVNCYDMCGLVNVFSAALGVDHVRALFLGGTESMPWWSFGYIRPTFLVGIYELCNNPFFEGAMNKPQVANDDKTRTSFGNHAFAIRVKTVFDACAGPFKGLGGIKLYTETAIDDRRTAADEKGWDVRYLWQQAAYQRAVQAVD